MTNGATIIYNQQIKPLHRKYKSQIEDFAESLNGFLSSASKEAVKTASKNGANLIKNANKPKTQEPEQTVDDTVVVDTS